MQSLGADAVVDYTKHKFEEVYANDPFDVVLDLVGGLSLPTRFPQCACLEVSPRRMTNAMLHVKCCSACQLSDLHLLIATSLARLI